VELGEGSGSIGSVIGGLLPGTVYYFRAYATNLVGTTYGGNLNIKTFDGSVSDHEGHIYSTVKLGNQEWLNRNLETKYFSNGDLINTTGTATQNTGLEENPSYQWAYQYHEEHPELLDDEGRLYTWFAATDSRKLCPAGWHLPSLEEWEELISHLGGDDLTYNDLRLCYNYNWESRPDQNNNEGSFWINLVGFRNVAGQFSYGSQYGTYWWTATESSQDNVNSIYCGPSEFDRIDNIEKSKKNGFSVRCIKD
jgi:uncharacterized protein (TIGR02145 family)